MNGKNGKLEQELAEVRRLAGFPEATTPIPASAESGMNEILDVILQNISRAKTRFKTALADPSNSQQAKDQEMEVFLASVRAELGRVQKLNNPVLLKAMDADFRAFKLPRADDHPVHDTTSDSGSEPEPEEEPVTQEEKEAAYDGIYDFLNNKMADNPRLGEFCAGIRLPVEGSDGKTFHLSKKVKDEHYFPTDHLESLATRLTPRKVTEIGSSDDLHILASGLASFGISPEWLVRTRRKIKTGKVRYPGWKPTVALGGDETAYIVPLLAAAIAHTAIRLDAIFDFQSIQEKRTLSMPKGIRGVAPEDKVRQIKLHLIEQVLGQKHVPAEDDEKQIDLGYQNMIDAMKIAFKKGDSYLATDDLFDEFAADLGLEYLSMLEPTGDEREAEFFPEIVPIFAHLKTIYTTLCKAP